MMGAKKTPEMVRNATPLYNAYKEENIFAALVCISTAGPIPVRIKHAMWKLSIQVQSAMV
jgi:hypothetical protein